MLSFRQDSRKGPVGTQATEVGARNSGTLAALDADQAARVRLLGSEDRACPSASRSLRSRPEPPSEGGPYSKTAFLSCGRMAGLGATHIVSPSTLPHLASACKRNRLEAPKRS